MYGISGNQLYRINFGGMENKKYLDKVLDFYVRNTIIDFDDSTIYTPFIDKIKFASYAFGDLMFGYYGEKHFGLTEDEIDYLWRKYTSIIKEKINNGR